ncbi:MAG TPA: ATP-dependent helicase, partial [Anaerolineaceae bacterium]
MSYRGGWMGVSAVPGSGKTETLSNLAARLIQDGAVGDGQEVLIVTFANSAVQNFESRIRRILDETGLLAIGYRVRTLHGLCHDIIRERPSLVGLPNDFQIADERVTGGILQDAAEAWVRSHPDFGQEWLDPDLSPGQVQKVLREGWPDLVKKIGYQFIKTAKDLQANPPAVRHRLEEIHTRLPLLEMGLEIYSDYQKALSYRGAVDFDDLIRLALAALEQDSDYLARLRARWPFILEDEAQDSNLLQEGILSRLAGMDGNWVRVGDPNQAIYETFTTASPRYLRAFITRVEQKPELLYSGRSTQTIMGLGNALVEWSRRDHPVMDLCDTLAETLIHATPLGDPQPNPPDDPLKVSIQRKPLSPDDELNRVVKSVRRWLDDPRHEMETLAILAFQNDRGAAFVDRFNRDGIPCIEVLKSTQETRRAAQAISSILHCLAWPDQSSPLDRAYRDWLAFRNERQSEAAVEDSLGSRVISRIKNPEEYLWSAGWEALPGIQAARQTAPAVFETLAAFREAARRWQAAVH